MRRLFIIFVILLGLGIPTSTYAHCPLCTAGAGALAVLASSFGISTASIGVFVGAFAVALGLWFANIIKRQFIFGQKWLLVLLSFLLTVVPLIPLLTDKHGSLYISWMGDYGTILNRTYALNLFIVGTLAGAILMLISPWLSRRLSDLRDGKRLAYQSIAIAFFVLIVASLIFQFLDK